MLTIVLSGVLLLALGCSRASVQDQSANNKPGAEAIAIPRDEEPVVAKSPAGLGVAGRGWSDAQANYETIGVRHWQLYIESPYEKDGSTNGRWETWGLEDAVATAAEPAIFLGKIIASPVSAALNHPWSCETSRSTFAPTDPTFEQPETPSGVMGRDNP